MSKQNLKQGAKFIALAGVAALLAVYAGNVLFGDRSFSVLRDLQSEKAFLIDDVERLRSENAKLQKLYLERASLDPDAKF